MEKDKKDIKIETDDDLGLDDKIKTGAKALGKKWKALIEILVNNTKHKKTKSS